MRSATRVHRGRDRRAIIPVAQQGKHHVIRPPARQIFRCANVRGDMARECAAQEPLRALVVKKPGQAGEQAVGEIAIQEGG